MMTMPGFNNDNIENQDPTFDAEACYEIIASQEEIYLEEIEEELRAILLFDMPHPSAKIAETVTQAVEELITGDSDDPPLSDETIVEMLSNVQINNA